MSLDTRARSALVSLARPPRSGSNEISAPNVVHVSSNSWFLQRRVLLIACLLAIFPPSSHAAPPTHRPVVRVAIHPRQGPGPQGGGGGGGGNPSDGSISMNVWLPILLVTILFVIFSFVTCIRRCAAVDAAAAANRAARAAGTTHSNGSVSRPRRRPRRTPSQISTKSLPPYMKEPGDQELVLFRGPSETEDMDPPPAMPTLTEDDEHPEMRGATFDIALDRVETVDTMADSTTNLMRGMAPSVPRPPELPHPASSGDRRRTGDGDSMDSAGSDAELLATDQRDVSLDHNAAPRGEAPSYAEAVAAEGGMTTISLNDPEPSDVPPRRSRFSFLTQKPFGSHRNTPPNVNPSPPIRSESPALHARTGSGLSRISTRESHESHHSRTPPRNITRSHSRSNSNLFRAWRSHSPGLHAESSTISLDSISAPLTHTVTRAEFHAPKGGLLTPEQIKLITSREALERFGVPYGPDAVAVSREKLAAMQPPPEFESVARPSASGSGGSGSEATTSEGDVARAPSRTHRTVERGASRASTAMSYETAPGDASQGQEVQMQGPGDEGEPDGDDDLRTARPATPRTARPLHITRH